MALRFALRSRIQLREEPLRARGMSMPPLALPVVAYWAVMGVLIYGVSSGALRARLGDRPRERAVFDASETHAPSVPRPLGATVTVATPRPAEPPLPLRAAAFEPVFPSHQRPRVAHVLRLAATGPSVGYESEQLPVGPAVSRDEAPSALDARDSRDARDSHDARVGASFRPSGAWRPDIEPTAPRAAPTTAGAVSSCEAVAAASGDEMDLTAARGGPDLTRDAFSAILEHGAYLAPCGVPDGTAIEICAAVRQGRALGVTVVTSPPSARVSACVQRVVASMTFPSNPRLDVTRTRFDAVRR